MLLLRLVYRTKMWFKSQLTNKTLVMHQVIEK